MRCYGTSFYGPRLLAPAALPFGRRAWRNGTATALLAAVCCGSAGVAAASDGAASPAHRHDDAQDPLRVALASRRARETEKALRLARMVTIHRDGFGVPHIEGQTDESVVFGLAYAQAEDFFWQVEDSYILALGRYCEVHGIRGLNSDLLNHAFQVVEQSRQHFLELPPQTRALASAYATGLNFYLATHPNVKPRLIQHFEPWHPVAWRRQIMLELCYRYTRLSDSYLPRTNERIWAATGSNGWALRGERTQSGDAMLLANPHLPWFGLAQMHEAHLMSGEGWNFTGATFFGSPMLMLGHNGKLGWTLTTNEPDIADVWQVRFDHPEDPLLYRYGEGYRRATEWQDAIKIKTRHGVREKHFTFRKTHHGPIVGKEDDQTLLAARICGLYDTSPFRQALRMIKSDNLAEFRTALAMAELPIMNVVYADRDDNILYLYGGRIPRRDPSFDWSQPVDGSDPRTEWRGIHTIDELPQVLNPTCGYVQNCNSSPFTTTHNDELCPDEYPAYMIEDRYDDKRRAKMSREILQGLADCTFERMQELAFDTTIYWARHKLPEYEKHFQVLQKTRPQLARRIEPYLNHLRAWDCRVTAQSTAATLCEAWYELLYGLDYPGERIGDAYRDNPAKQLEALAVAAEQLQRMHGDWKVPYADLHRIQRPPRVPDILAARFSDDDPSLPCISAHGPMGVIFTQYFTPSAHIPFVITQRKRYGVVGATYLGVYEFGRQGVRAASLVHFGQSGDPDSPHYFDQAHFLSECRLKPVPFTHPEVMAAARRSYHPGQ